ncbi:PHB depolymerase family esterase [Phytohabitans sp. ZYX-F-186]|uniref:PHB depolymerase family esterase n=1 Tax=Phytohabitans maris TaxID=3071409 RepID=A0ABU0ZTM7_9ACTN|nr:PHB depolymerase family esterase [Phytohabitans sp. ZYX-F-186]MDQ7910396.1 PHB depolymerase family esterase [Phytohabitans sp. ZYX-F-186]
MNKLGWVAAVTAVALLGTGCDAIRRYEKPPPPPLPTGSSAHTTTVDGRERTFRVYRPASLPDSGAIPLVVMLHGALGGGSQAESSYGWNPVADREGFVVAYPDGLNHAWAVSDGCCGPPAREGVNDVAFVARVVAIVSGQVRVDPARVYATGISNGGMLAYRLACDTTTFAAIGAVSATMLDPCTAPAPISVIHIHGTADRTIPYQGGPGRRDNDGTGRVPARIDGPPIPAVVDTWRRVDGCGAPASSTAGPVTRAVSSCPDGRATELVTIAGAGHQWPGSTPPGPVARRLGLDEPSSALDATGTIWSFFDSHPRP